MRQGSSILERVHWRRKGFTAFGVGVGYSVEHLHGQGTDYDVVDVEGQHCIAHGF